MPATMVTTPDAIMEGVYPWVKVSVFPEETSTAPTSENKRVVSNRNKCRINGCILEENLEKAVRNAQS